MKFRHLNHFEFFILVKLTHFWPALAFYTPRKRHKTFNFLVFSRDVCPSSLRDGGILIGGKGIFLLQLSVTEIIWPREFLNCQKFTIPFLKKITNTSQEHKFWSSFFFFFYIFSWFYLINLIPYTYPHVFPSNLTKWLQHISCKLHYFVTVQAHLTFQAGSIVTGTGGKPCGFKRLGGRVSCGRNNVFWEKGKKSTRTLWGVKLEH